MSKRKLNEICIGETIHEKCIEEYKEEIKFHWKKLEGEIPLKEIQKKFSNASSSKNRFVLVEWALEVLNYYDLNLETSFCCINMIDRILAMNKEGKKVNKLQTIAIVCIYVSAKYEEVDSLSLEDILSIGASRLSKLELKDLELKLLSDLNWKIPTSLSVNFLADISKEMKCSKYVLEVSKMILEISLLNPEFSSTLPSMVSTSSLIISNFMVNRNWCKESPSTLLKWNILLEEKSVRLYYFSIISDL